MTASRTTRPAESARRLLGLGVFAAALGLSGCGKAPPGAADAAGPGWQETREPLPPPETDRIEYDAPNRTLSLYDLPGRDHWMVRLPGERHGRPVGPRHRLPEGVDTTRTVVYYARPGVAPSGSVTVADIEANRAAHNSLAVNR